MLLLTVNTQISQLAFLHGYLYMKMHVLINGISSVSFFFIHACICVLGSGFGKYILVWITNLYGMCCPWLIAVLAITSHLFTAYADVSPPCPAQWVKGSGQPPSTATPTSTLKVTEIKTRLHFTATELCRGSSVHPHGCSLLTIPTKTLHPTRSHVLPGHKHPSGCPATGQCHTRQFWLLCAPSLVMTRSFSHHLLGLC